MRNSSCEINRLGLPFANWCEYGLFGLNFHRKRSAFVRLDQMVDIEHDADGKWSFSLLANTDQFENLHPLQNFCSKNFTSGAVAAYFDISLPHEVAQCRTSYLLTKRGVVVPNQEV